MRILVNHLMSVAPYFRECEFFVVVVVVCSCILLRRVFTHSLFIKSENKEKAQLDELLLVCCIVSEMHHCRLSALLSSAKKKKGWRSTCLGPSKLNFFFLNSV